MCLQAEISWGGNRPQILGRSVAENDHEIARVFVESEMPDEKLLTADVFSGVPISSEGKEEQEV